MDPYLGTEMKLSLFIPNKKQQVCKTQIFQWNNVFGRMVLEVGTRAEKCSDLWKKTTGHVFLLYLYFADIIYVSSTPLPKTPLANEGLAWDFLLLVKM